MTGKRTSCVACGFSVRTPSDNSRDRARSSVTGPEDVNIDFASVPHLDLDISFPQSVHQEGSMLIRQSPSSRQRFRFALGGFIALIYRFRSESATPKRSVEILGGHGTL